MDYNALKACPLNREFPPSHIMTIRMKITYNQYEDIPVFSGDHPHLIALKFCRKHALDQNVCLVMERKIEEELTGLNHSNSTPETTPNPRSSSVRSMKTINNRLYYKAVQNKEIKENRLKAMSNNPSRLK